MTRLLAVVAFVVAVAACGDPRASHYTPHEPAVADVVGRYEYDADLTYFGDEVAPLPETDPPSVLILRADGTFTATDLPADQREFDPVPLVSASGQWTIGTVGQVYSGDEGRPVYAIEFDGEPRLQSASILDDAPPHRLAISLGDPDEGAGMALRRAD